MLNLISINLCLFLDRHIHTNDDGNSKMHKTWVWGGRKKWNDKKKKIRKIKYGGVIYEA